MRYPNFNASYILSAVVVCYTTLTFLIGLPFQFFLFTASLTYGGEVDQLTNQRMVYWKGQCSPAYLQSLHKPHTSRRCRVPHLGWQSYSNRKNEVSWIYSESQTLGKSKEAEKPLQLHFRERYRIFQLAVLSRKHLISTRWHYPHKWNLQLLRFWISLEVNSKKNISLPV